MRGTAEHFYTIPYKGKNICNICNPVKTYIFFYIYMVYFCSAVPRVPRLIFQYVKPHIFIRIFIFYEQKQVFCAEHPRNNGPRDAN